MKLSIVIPAYNEARTIHFILDKVIAVQLINGIAKEIIIVNDCSKDDTVEVVKAYMAEHPTMDIKLFEQPVNMGKGAALHRGIKEATGDYLIIQDADLEYDPEEYNLLLRPVIGGFCRCRIRIEIHGRKSSSYLIFLALDRQQNTDIRLQYVHQPQLD